MSALSSGVSIDGQLELRFPTGRYRLVNYWTMVDYGVLCDDLHAALRLMERLGPDYIAVEEGANEVEACLASREWDYDREVA